MSATLSSSPCGSFRVWPFAGTNSAAVRMVSRMVTRGEPMTTPLCETKVDAYRDPAVHGDAAATRWREADLFGGTRGRFVQAVSEAAHGAPDPDAVRRGEFDLEHDGAFDAERLRLLGVERFGLEHDFGG